MPILQGNSIKNRETPQLIFFTQGGQLQSADSIDQVLSHEVKELGTHILVCEVSYSAPGKSKMNFRKFFKFNVMKPLDVKTKFYNAEVCIS